MPTTTDQLINDARCIDKCIPDGQKMSVLLSVFYQLLQNGAGGGGSGVSSVTGDGTVFNNAASSGAVTLSLANQAANTLFSGPAAGGAAAPSFRAMVAADLGTALHAQFGSVGIGTSPGTPSAAVPSIDVLNPGNAGGVIVGRFDSAGGLPFISVGGSAANTGLQLSYSKAANSLTLNIAGNQGMTITSGGNVSADAGVFACQGSDGISGSFNGTNTVTVVGGIVTGIA